MCRALPRVTRRQAGTALIVCLGILTLLAILAFAFTTMSSQERAVTKSFTDFARAKMLAVSGIELAVEGLRASLLSNDPNIQNRRRYYGEDLNENLRPDGGEDQNGNGFEVLQCPLYRALHPSFMEDLNGNNTPDSGDLIEIRDQPGNTYRVGISGRQLGTYAPDGDFFLTKVVDLSSRIYVNMENHPHLRAILQNLSEEAGVGRGVGDRIYNNRPYFSLEEIRKKANLSDVEWAAMEPLVTVYAWLDKSVVNAVPLSRRYRRGLGIGSHVYTWEEIRPVTIELPRAANGQVIGRAPVNVNSAPREVLVALIRNLDGFYLSEEQYGSGINSGYALMQVRYTYSGSNGSLGQISRAGRISHSDARRLADEIIRERRANAFQSWQQFNDFLWDLYRRGRINRQQMDVMRANFNPNSNINDYNPDFHRFQWVDKTDLLYWTTEFCFTTMGFFEVRSLGRVLTEDHKIAAEAEIQTIVKTFDIYRETTQKDFLEEFWQDGRPIRDYIITRERGAGTTFQDLSIVPFPEPLEAAWVRDADYDGYLVQATKEHRIRSAAFRAHYARSVWADSGHRQLPDRRGPYRNRLVASASGGSGAWTPGKLFNDGVYAELDSVPMYNFRPADIHNFTFSMWVKPHFFPEHAGRTRVYMTFQEHRGSGWFSVIPLGLYCTVKRNIEANSEGGYSYQEAWDTPAMLAGGCVGHWEGACGTACINHLEHGHTDIVRGGIRFGTWFRGGRWMHVGWIHYGEPQKTRAYQYPGTEHNEIDILYINGWRVSGLFSFQTGDVSYPTNYPGQQLRLGERRNAGNLNTVPDSTLDEVLMWNVAHPWNSVGLLLNIWQDGRYYQENDGRFTSREVDLAVEAGLPAGTPVTISKVYWTQYAPDTLSNGRVCVELLRASNRRNIHPSNVYYTNFAGSVVDQIVDFPIRYRLRFEPRNSLAPNVDGLVFDDITITFVHAPRFLSWSWVTDPATN